MELSAVKYRPDIDGLRAVAVLCVLFFHYEVALFSGGFVGVDIFFVISGFLITRLIFEEYQRTGKFNFLAFYERRARRLFPALFFTLVMSFLLGVLLFSPQHLQRLSAMALSSLGMASNIFLWNESGYFNTSAVFKPLLHTWSLSVEEQYYLIWPAFLVLVFRYLPRYMMHILIGVFLLSLALNLEFADGNIAWLKSSFPSVAAWFRDGAATIFYLTPFRVFEFAVGAALVFAPLLWSKQPVFQEFVFVAGLLLIVIAVVVFDRDTRFPSYKALLPCVGSAMVILGGQSGLSRKLLGTKLFVGIGLISYSLYLVHWPAIVFYRYFTFRELEFLDITFLFSGSLIMAFLMYRYIEQPFRRRGKSIQRSGRRNFIPYCAGLSLVLAMPSAHAWQDRGWVWRFPTHMAKDLSYDVSELAAYVGRNRNALRKPFSGSGEEGLKILVVGDSMAGNFVNLLVESGVAEKHQVRSIVINAMCQAINMPESKPYPEYLASREKQCRREHAQFRNNPNFRKADVVILASAWHNSRNHWSLSYLAETVNYLESIGASRVGVVAVHSQAFTGLHYLARISRSSNNETLKIHLPRKTLETNDKLRQVNADFILIDTLKLFCDGDRCPMVTNNGHLIFYDRGHLTQPGAEYLGNKLSRSAEFQSLFALPINAG